jgi:LmbE family N-acetylglucosaminyl deacetylase
VQGRLLLVFAHPDDEAFLTAGTVARHVSAGGEAALICATRGERGRQPPDPICLPSELGKVRAAELEAACRVMGVSRLVQLGYPDGGLADVDVEEAVGAIAREMRRWRPGAVVTFGPDGVYGHPDHVAVSLLTAAAFDGVFGEDRPRPDRDGSRSGARGAPDATGPRLWHVSLPPHGGSRRPSDPTVAAIDILPHLERKIRALLCHRTQRHNVERAFGGLYDFEGGRPVDDEAAALLGREYFRLARGPLPRRPLEESLLDP